jgi:hypothetical protein
MIDNRIQFTEIQKSIGLMMEAHRKKMCIWRDLTKTDYPECYEDPKDYNNLRTQARREFEQKKKTRLVELYEQYLVITTLKGLK